ncbi:hypothetical protein PBI_KALPINE_88 [Mycobacterium phage Kalpine]|nr:hypothetical protein PBI_KALPINE_88 [Mycobacterium phage Kalpine]
MKKHLLTAVIASITTIGILGLSGPAEASPPTIPFSQSAFPCQEDEVLGYAPEFGPDNVGCIHVDLLKR